MAGGYRRAGSSYAEEAAGEPRQACSAVGGGGRWQCYRSRSRLSEPAAIRRCNRTTTRNKLGVPDPALRLAHRTMLACAPSVVHDTFSPRPLRPASPPSRSPRTHPALSCSAALLRVRGEMPYAAPRPPRAPAAPACATTRPSLSAAAPGDAAVISPCGPPGGPRPHDHGRRRSCLVGHLRVVRVWGSALCGATPRTADAAASVTCASCVAGFYFVFVFLSRERPQVYLYVVYKLYTSVRPHVLRLNAVFSPSQSSFQACARLARGI